MSTWRPISDKPEENQEIIATVKLPGGKLMTMYCVYNRDKYICPPGRMDITNMVTHWMPMPKPYEF